LSRNIDFVAHPEFDSRAALGVSVTRGPVGP
jgi:hypothetical protein